ncbi:MAG: phosphohistidine phosphatase SixA [Nitrospiraceae bacterium]
MDCILFRHGIAVEPEEWKGSEAQRPLTPKGAERVRAGAAGLVELGVTPTHILSSPLLRAFDTAKIIRDTLRTRLEIRICDELAPDASPDKLVPLLAALPEDACVICVGHEPHLGETAGVLLFGQPVTGLSLKKSGACGIRFEGVPKSGQGTLRWWLAPAHLRALGGR